jgi:Fe-S oxidoreductase
MFSQEAIHHAAGCSICWMCRHLCPIGNVTGREIHFPRGKATLVSLTVRGNDMLKESAQAMFDCLLCNACANWCETGYEPARFIREARRELVVTDALPETIRKNIAAALEDEGCIYGRKGTKGELHSEVANLPNQADILLVLGDSVAIRNPEIGIAAIHLLRRAGVEFTVLKNEPSTGSDLYDLIGETQEVQTIAKRLTEAIKTTECSTVVALDPFTARIMLEDYRRWGCDLPRVRTATAVVSELVETGKLIVNRPLEMRVTFHDPDRLARDLKETELVRKIISAMAGPWKEIFLHGANARSCGNDVVGSYSPQIVEMTGRARMDDALRTGAELLVTASASDKGILCEVGEPNMYVEDIFVLMDACTEREG